MDWVPNEASLTQVVELLKECHSPDTETQRLVEQVFRSTTLSLIPRPPYYYNVCL